MKQNEMCKKIIVIAIALLMTLEVSAQDMSGWRSPTNDELGDISWRKDDPALYLKGTGDFDGDGKQDSVSILVNDKENKMGLFVHLSSKPGKSIRLTEFEGKSWIQTRGVRIAPPGKYETACGKGYWECQKGEPGSLDLKLPAIDFFKEGSANHFFIWDKKARQFKSIDMSD